MNTVIEIDEPAVPLKVGQAIRVDKINKTIDGQSLFPGIWQVVEVLQPREGKARYRIEKISDNRHERRAKEKK